MSGTEGTFERARQRAVMGRTQTLVLFLFVVVVFLALAVRSEHQADQIRHQNTALAKSSYRSCLESRAIYQHFNTAQGELEAIERDNPVADPEVRKRRIAAYHAARLLPLPDCEARR